MKKYLECHQYEPDQKNFESCNVTTYGRRAITSHCLDCRYNSFSEKISKEYAEINKDVNSVLEDEVCNLPSPCTAQCGVLQKGDCLHLSVDEIKALLDKTDWDSLDKGECITPYLMRENTEKE